MNNGRINTLITVSRHSSVSMTAKRRWFDQVGHDVDNGIADGVLRADHVIVEARHQLARFVLVKNRSDMRCKRANNPNAGRRSRLRRQWSSSLR
jgi:hypothetical protein